MIIKSIDIETDIDYKDNDCNIELIFDCNNITNHSNSKNTNNDINNLPQQLSSRS